ncbi:MULTISPECIES: HigA family addiction module antitoxin [unclassified Oceanispirochaeta]|uniref:HigA family addiction module antitoxin n=1 Tax=unclassified Oceanispirochaeta TaxID=2635722 RepID=UPI000E08E6A4|nr:MULTISPECIES: HigA family addiction module antitoxin [unclassified Oceanispirochaeta]MBF9017010.1 HigA family addiction module antidote protein [Oceanispirochaeta sp. M2]NPD73459.1 HigA family addiction module antidote protein [Oceanispirochaeta sp. M1]RDG30752.1 addiction module antidote protein, HigA family [Oceanispirochaeta sp. M1]
MAHDLIELSTPGEVLKEEFLDPLGITSYALAKAIFVDPPRIASIIKGSRKITADTALRFSRFFGNSAGFWMNMQTRYDLETQEEEKHEDLSKIHLYHTAS